MTMIGLLSRPLSTAKALSTLAVVSAGAYVEFFSHTVPTPIGVILALGILPTGDIIRWVTRRMQINTERRQNKVNNDAR